MNRIILIGNLGADPEHKEFGNGGFVKLRVATTEHWRDRQTQERREITEWHSVTVNGPQGDNCMKYLKKGSKVAIEGSMRSRKVPAQDGGPDRTFWEVRAQNVQFLDRREDRGGYDEGSRRGGGNDGGWPTGNAGGPTGWDAQSKGGGNGGGWGAGNGGGNGGGWGGQANGGGNGGNGGGWGGQANGGGNGGNGGGWGGQANGGGNGGGWGGQANGGGNGGGWGSSTTSTDTGSSAGWGGNAGGGDGGDDGGQGMPF